MKCQPMAKPGKVRPLRQPTPRPSTRPVSHTAPATLTSPPWASLMNWRATTRNTCSKSTSPTRPVNTSWCTGWVLFLGPNDLNFAWHCEERQSRSYRRLFLYRHLFLCLFLHGLMLHCLFLHGLMLHCLFLQGLMLHCLLFTGNLFERSSHVGSQGIRDLRP